MVQKPPAGDADDEPGGSAGDLCAVNGDFVRAIERALDEGDADTVRALIEPLYEADIADLLQTLTTDERREFVQLIRAELVPEVIAELDEAVRDEIIEDMSISDIAAAVSEMETDDALTVIADLDADDQQQVLDAIPVTERALIEEALTYPEYSAGRLMQRELVAVPGFWTVGQAVDFIRGTAEDNPDLLPYNFYDVFVVDPRRRPLGAVRLSRLLRSRRPELLSDIMETDLKTIGTHTDQEEVAFLFRQRDLTSAPVVDQGGRLVGVITIDDVVDVIDEEHEDDMLRLAGVGSDDLYRATIETARSRFAWLLVNLATAILASAVIGLFDATIEQMVALAVLMPIVASMGGNAGTQTLTVVVRAIATRELAPANTLRLFGKELLVGLINGIVFAVVTGGAAWLWFGNSTIAVVISLAMVFNMVVAAVGGFCVPLALQRAGIDPAIASGVFVTTITDVVGFFAFLGLATILLPPT